LVAVLIAFLHLHFEKSTFQFIRLNKTIFSLEHYLTSGAFEDKGQGVSKKAVSNA
jgi:hypothetical protein